MPKATLILNADDPLSYSLSLCRNKRVSFGINEELGGGSISDNRFCPLCSAELSYKYKTLGQLGGFYCPRCSYRRRSPDVALGGISGSGFFLSYKGKSRLAYTSLEGAYNLYNYCAAAAALLALGAGDIGALSTFSGAFGRMERFEYGGRTVLLLLVKNPVGLTGCIRYVSELEESADIAFALNDNAADSADVSWIWDSDFTPLAKNGGRVITLGLRSYDMALRLKYDGITPDRIIEGENYSGLINEIKNGKRDFIVFANYTSMMNMRRYFIGAFGGKEFWE